MDVQEHKEVAQPFEVGDIVGRLFHDIYILFKITEILDDGQEKRALLRGLVVRLIADAPFQDLKKK